MCHSLPFGEKDRRKSWVLDTNPCSIKIQRNKYGSVTTIDNYQLLYSYATNHLARLVALKTVTLLLVYVAGSQQSPLICKRHTS